MRYYKNMRGNTMENFEHRPYNHNAEYFISDVLEGLKETLDDMIKAREDNV